MKVGDLIYWQLPDMTFKGEKPILGLVVEDCAEFVLCVQWVDTGIRDFVNAHNCCEPREFNENK